MVKHIHVYQSVYLQKFVIFFKLMHLFLKLPLEKLEGTLTTFNITGIRLSPLFMHDHCISMPCLVKLLLCEKSMLT